MLVGVLEVSRECVLVVRHSASRRGVCAQGPEGQVPGARGEGAREEKVKLALCGCRACWGAVKRAASGSGLSLGVIRAGSGGW